jgi:hypothetical protein
MSASFQRIVAGVRISSLIRVVPDPVLRSVAEPFASRNEIVDAAPLIA